MFLVIIVTGFLTACDSESDPVDELTVYSATINGTSFSDGLSNVPINGMIVITFSHTLNSEAFAGAFSFSDTQGEANYTANLGNTGSKAVIAYSDLNPDSNYTISINQGALGNNGETLNSGFSRSFTSAAEAEETKTPCTSATEDCLQEIEISDGFTFEFYSSFDIVSDADYTWDEIEDVIFVIHGQNRDADEYFRYMTTAVGDIGNLENTLVIAPYFREESSADSGELFWDSNWREGANSGNSPAGISSFTVLDKMVDYLANQEKFPNLKKIFFAGHSSGAAMVQHYAISNKSETSYTAYEFKYVVANNQYFYYPDGQRYNESTGDFFTPTDCTGYNYWPYGYEFAPAYVDGKTQEDLLQQQVSSNTIYLLGTNDTVTEGTLNTTDCAATLLGSNRLERGRNMFTYFETFYASENNHEKIEVEGVGHDASAMFNSNEFKSLFTSD